MKVIEHQAGWIISDSSRDHPGATTYCYWTGNGWSIEIGQAMIYSTPADAEADIANLPLPPE